MASALAKFRKNRVSADKLQDKLSSKGRARDERFWYPQRDDKNQANTVIRFLPAPDGQTFFQAYQSHAFSDKNKSKWFIHKCPKTLGKDKQCPACDSFWDAYHDAGKDMSKVPPHIRSRGPEQHYVSNILVIKDPMNPQNEGKVFLFDYKNFFMNKIKGALNPEFDDEIAFNPFDLWDGANFNFRIHMDGKQLSYNRSQWMPNGPVTDDEEELERLVGLLHPLDEFKFEKEINDTSLGDLIKDFNRVTGEGLLNEVGQDSYGGDALGSAGDEALAPESKAASTDDVPFDTDDNDDDGFDESKFSDLLDD